jgi:outer membrane protein OmpA-like peptidoglycan-associated protein
MVEISLRRSHDCRAASKLPGDPHLKGGRNMIRIHDSRSLRSVLSLLVVAASLSGCASMNSTTKGAIIGAAGGGVVGGAIGKANGSTAKGAIIGAVLGGTAGALIGHQMDKQAAELRHSIPGATVERVGEGILVTFASGLLFDFDSDNIRGNTRSNLDQLARSLAEYPGSNLMIVGHTDAVGADSYNQDLSERRSAAAGRYLDTRGVSRSRMATRGVGETEPVASNDTDAGKSRNRRIEVAIYAGDAWRDQARGAATN